jgi:hypothetical protein
MYSFFIKSIDTPHGPTASRNSQFAEHAQAEALGPEIAESFRAFARRWHVNFKYQHDPVLGEKVNLGDHKIIRGCVTLHR